jgi:Short C-terminal domain
MGLVRGMARTAVIAGTATHVSNNVSRRQAARWDQKAQAQQAPPQQAYAPPPQQPVYAAPPPQAAPADDGPDLDKLRELADLHAQGILSDEEFAAAKAKELGI